MTSLPTRQQRYTVGEYLRLERDSREKHEYRDGRILAMSGGTYYHSVISINFNGELRHILKGKPCQVFESNLRVRIPRTPLYTYPDGGVVCGTPLFDPNDDRAQTVLNPILIAEVLSASIETYDRGEKFDRYRELDSLQEYVLINQDRPRIELFFRQADGTWLFTVIAGLHAVVRLSSLGINLPLAEVYRGVEFPPETDASPSPTGELTPF